MAQVTAREFALHSYSAQVDSDFFDDFPDDFDESDMKKKLS